MEDIYRTADRTLIYLGSDVDDHAESLKSLISHVHAITESKLKQFRSWEMPPKLNKEDPLATDTRWHSYQT